MTITETVRVAVNEATEVARDAQRVEMLLSLVGLVDAVTNQRRRARFITLEASDQGPWLILWAVDGDESSDFDDGGYPSHLYTDDHGYLMTRLDDITGLVATVARRDGTVRYTLDIAAFRGCPLFRELVGSLT